MSGTNPTTLTCPLHQNTSACPCTRTRPELSDLRDEWAAAIWLCDAGHYTYGPPTISNTRCRLGCRITTRTHTAINPPSVPAVSMGLAS